MGHFHYVKRKWGIDRTSRVDVFSLRVSVEQETWLEQKKRERIWLPPKMAVARIEEPQLRDLMLTFLTTQYRPDAG